MQSRLKVAGYVRVSEADVARRNSDSFMSPEEQREKIQERYGSVHEIVWFEPELDVSGAKARRPVLDGIVGRIEAGELDGLVVARLSRLSRLTPRERVELLDRIEGAGGVILSAIEQTDTSTPEGRFVRELFFGIARMEWERLRDNFVYARRRAVGNGIHVASRLPLGYDRDEQRRLVPNEQADVVRGIFERRARGWSLGEIAKWTDEQGCDLSNSTVRYVLRNSVYLGRSFSGEASREDAHEPLIDRATWERVQGAKTLSRGGERNGRSKRALLQGFVRCGGCGHAMVATFERGTVRYVCRRRQCRARSRIDGKALEAFVLEQVEDEIVWYAEPKPSRDEAYERALRRLEAARAELEAFVTAPMLGVDPAVWQKGYDARAARVEQAKQALPAATQEDELAKAVSQLDPAWQRRLGPTWQKLRKHSEVFARDRLRKILALTIDRIDVQPAHGVRGLPVEDRVSIQWAQSRAEIIPLGVAA